MADMPAPAHPRTFAFDFAGVISLYKGGFKSGSQCGEDEPNAEVVKAITTLFNAGHKIIIHSTLHTDIIRTYCERHGIPFTYTNENPEFSPGNPGKPIATVYIDDRAFTYSGQTAEELVPLLESFEPYYKK